MTEQSQVPRQEAETKAVNEVELGAQQKEASDKAVAWYERAVSGDEKQNLFILAGLAGTGKTTTFNQIVKRLGISTISYMAYTNMAAKVMRDVAGVPAKTIHQSIYRVKSKDTDFLNDLADRIEGSHDPKEQELLRQELNEAKAPGFSLRPREDFYGVDLILLDECSMVDGDLLKDIFSFGIPVMALGDPGQLPPPTNIKGGIFSHKPDVLLTEIHRQAADNPIIEASLNARKGIPLKVKPFVMPTPEDLQVPGIDVFTARGVTPEQWFELMKMHDFTICWKNDTRHTLNSVYRAGMGYAEESPYLPVPGETLVCRSNYRDKGLFNGMFVEVTEIVEEFEDTIKMGLRPLDSDNTVYVEVFRAPFQLDLDPDGEKNLKSWQFRETIICHYGYAGTAHTAQGSQYPSVLIYDENVLRWPKVREQRKQWLYTALSRAQIRDTVMVRIGR